MGIDITDVPKMVDSQPGDNTVMASIVERLGDAWSQTGSNDVTLHVTPDDVNHSSIIQCKFTLDLVKELMLEEAAPVAGYESTSDSEDDDSTMFKNCCRMLRDKTSREG